MAVRFRGGRDEKFIHPEIQEIENPFVLLQPQLLSQFLDTHSVRRIRHDSRRLPCLCRLVCFTRRSINRRSCLVLIAAALHTFLDNGSRPVTCNTKRKQEPKALAFSLVILVYRFVCCGTIAAAMEVIDLTVESDSEICHVARYVCILRYVWVNPRVQASTPLKTREDDPYAA